MADLGNWPATRIDPDAHRIIRHAYEEVLTACARLISFSTGSASIGDDGPINDRQEILAAADLISFAIHARRLIETTGQKSRFNKIEIVFSTGPIAYPYMRGTLQKPRIWKVITRIIHNQNITIIRDAWSREDLFRRLFRFRSPVLPFFPDERNVQWREVGLGLDVVVSNIPNENFPPIVIVRSKEGTILFPIRELTETFQNKILAPIIDLCSEHHLFLEDLVC